MSNKFRPGKIVIISSPSGVGKTSICKGLLTDERKNDGWKFSISYTTRGKRPSEEHGREYFFVDQDEFEKMVSADKFAEHFKVHLYNYGTPRSEIEEIVQNGGVILLDVDLQGALKIKNDYPEAITIFVLPPSVEAWGNRLTARGTETAGQLKVRFENARDEVKSYDKFENIVINDKLNLAIEEVLDIISSSGKSEINQSSNKEVRNVIERIKELSSEQIDQFISSN